MKDMCDKEVWIRTGEIVSSIQEVLILGVEKELEKSGLSSVTIIMKGYPMEQFQVGDPIREPNLELRNAAEVDNKDGKD